MLTECRESTYCFYISLAWEWNSLHPYNLIVPISTNCTRLQIGSLSGKELCLLKASLPFPIALKHSSKISKFKIDQPYTVISLWRFISNSLNCDAIKNKKINSTTKTNEYTRVVYRGYTRWKFKVKCLEGIENVECEII